MILLWLWSRYQVIGMVITIKPLSMQPKSMISRALSADLMMISQQVQSRQEQSVCDDGVQFHFAC